MKSRCEGLGVGSRSCRPQDSERGGAELTRRPLNRYVCPQDMDSCPTRLSPKSFLACAWLQAWVRGSLLIWPAPLRCP